MVETRKAHVAFDFDVSKISRKYKYIKMQLLLLFLFLCLLLARADVDVERGNNCESDGTCTARQGQTPQTQTQTQTKPILGEMPMYLRESDALRTPADLFARYAALHAATDVRTPSTRVLVFRAPGQGWANRIRTLASAYLFAVLSGRVLAVDWLRPVSLAELVDSPIDWYTPLANLAPAERRDAPLVVCDGPYGCELPVYSLFLFVLVLAFDLFGFVFVFMLNAMLF